MNASVRETRLALLDTGIRGFAGTGDSELSTKSTYECGAFIFCVCTFTSLGVLATRLSLKL